MLKVNLVLYVIILPGVTILARLSSYANDITTLVMNNDENDKVSRAISRYKIVTRAKVNHDNSVGLRLVTWNGVSLPI